MKEQDLEALFDRLLKVTENLSASVSYLDDRVTFLELELENIYGISQEEDQSPR